MFKIVIYMHVYGFFKICFFDLFWLEMVENHQESENNTIKNLKKHLKNNKKLNFENQFFCVFFWGPLGTPFKWR